MFKFITLFFTTCKCRYYCNSRTCNAFKKGQHIFKNFITLTNGFYNVICIKDYLNILGTWSDSEHVMSILIKIHNETIRLSNFYYSHTYGHGIDAWQNHLNILSKHTKKYTYVEIQARFQLFGVNKS